MHWRDAWSRARYSVLLLAAMSVAWTSGTATAQVAAPLVLHDLAPLAGQPGGDIPDTAVYLRYQSRRFSVDYVEGWLQTTTARGVVFNDKDSSVVVELRAWVRRSLASYVERVDLPHLSHTAGFRRGTLVRDSIGGYAALHLTYRARSAPDAVTGKTVTLQCDRYYVNGPQALAVLTLSTPLGVDNVDGFRRISHSFRFR